jgi:hypothetical protein
MNILKRELRDGLKPFIFWTIGLFVLVFAGMTKYMGIETSGSSLNELIDKFPRVVLAFMGMVGVDINTFGGYYAILVYYALICAVIYAIHLGSNAVSRETVDPKARLHARMIFYNGEDPATGSAAGCTAAWMAMHGVAKSDERVLIEQGIETKRPSQLFVRAEKKSDSVVNVRVGGRAVEVARGELYF